MENPVSDKTGVTLNFAAEDEAKVTVNTSFKQSEPTVYAKVTQTQELYNSAGKKCLCLSSCPQCSSYTVTNYENIACISESAFTPKFDNTEQVFYARHFDYWNYKDNDFNPAPYCVKNNSVYATEYYKAEFKKDKSGKVLTYSVIPTSKRVDSKWNDMSFQNLFMGESKQPVNETELAEVNRVYKQSRSKPIDINEVLTDSAISVNYKTDIKDFNTKYDPVSMINSLKKKVKGKYTVNVLDENHDCHDITLNRKKEKYSYSIGMKLCRVNNTQSDVTVSDAEISVHGTGVIDLTGFSKEVKEIAAYLK